MAEREAKLRVTLEGNAQSELRKLAEEVRRLGASSERAKPGLEKTGEASKKVAQGARRVSQETRKASQEISQNATAWARAAREADKSWKTSSRLVTTVKAVSEQVAAQTRRLTENVRVVERLTKAQYQLARAEQRVSLWRRAGAWARGMGSRAIGGAGALGRGVVGGALPVVGRAALAGLGALPGLGMIAGISTLAGATALGVGGSAAALGYSAREASQLDSSMSRVRAVSMASREEMASLRQQAASLGASTVFTAPDVGKVQENFLRAGFSAQEAMAAVPAALAYATASGEDTGFASSALAQSVRSLGFDASQAKDLADVFTVAGASANIDAASLAETLKYAAPVFAALGRGDQRTALEDVTALTGILGDKGIQGSMAGTALRAAYAALSAPTDKATGTLRRLGVNAKDDQGNVRRLPELISDLREALQGKGTAEQQSALGAIFGIRNAGVIAALLDTSPERFDSLVRAMRDSSDAAERTARIMADNLAGDLEALGGSLSGLGTTIGGYLMPDIRASVESLTGFVDALHGAVEASGVGAAIFGDVGASMKSMTNAFIDFSTTAAPQFLRLLEMLGLADEGAAQAFAQEMANATVEASKERAERLGQRTLDQLTNEMVKERGRLLGVEGSLGASRGSTGELLVRDVERRLKDAGLDDMLQNPEVAAILEEAGGIETFGGRRGDKQRRDILDRLREVVVPEAERRLAARESEIESQKAAVRSAVAATQGDIEAQRAAMQHNAAYDAMSDDERYGGWWNSFVAHTGRSLQEAPFIKQLEEMGLPTPTGWLGRTLEEHARADSVQKVDAGQKDVVQAIDRLGERLQQLASHAGRTTNGAD